jgi:SWIRM domain
MEARNAVIDAYREDPSSRLTNLDCRRLLGGDVNAVYRILSFLESWGGTRRRRLALEPNADLLLDRSAFGSRLEVLGSPCTDP